MTARRGADWLQGAPAFTAGVFLLPIGAGLFGTVLPAFGYLPAIGGSEFSLAPWRMLIAYPGFATSVMLTLATGVLTSVLAVILAVGFCAHAYGRPWARRIGTWLAPLLSTPHSALAIGFAFLILPSGWIVRAISPWLTGWTLPPDVATVGHHSGLALVFGLLLKEVPYLILMIAGALNQVPAREHLTIARALGYARAEAWLKAILPQIYPQIRLPIYAVIAFSLSVVDVGLILGPSNPPTLSVLAVRWFFDADIQMYFPAAAAACLQLMLVIATILLWFGLERIVVIVGRRWIAAGGRGGLLSRLARPTAVLTCTLFALSLLAIVGMALWSVAAQWRYPEALPQAWTWTNWLRRADSLPALSWTTLVIGALATAIAVVLVLACLENESGRGKRAGTGALWILYLPLLFPQIAFLFGAQVLLVRLELDGTLLAVVWAHLIFVLPYLFLSLVDPWRAFDPRYARTAASLGAPRSRVFFLVKLPILLRPLLIACAVAFAVSVGQYLATLFAGNGRVATLTTEAVTLAGGADRRVIGAYALVQSLFPFLVYLMAVALPALLYANRRGLTRWT